MPTALALAGLILALCAARARPESAELRFLGQTDFVVNESSRAVVRLVVERVGDPVNVTALVLVGHSLGFHARLFTVRRATDGEGIRSFERQDTAASDATAAPYVGVCLCVCVFTYAPVCVPL